MICKLSVAKKPKCDIAAAIPVRSYVKVFCDGSYNGSFDISIESMSGSREFQACESVRLEVVNVYGDGSEAREKVGIDLNAKMETPIPPVVAGAIWLFTLSVEPSAWESIDHDVLADLNAINDSVVSAQAADDQQQTSDSAAGCEQIVSGESSDVSPGFEEITVSGPMSFEPSLSDEEKIADLAARQEFVESMESKTSEGQQSSGE